MRLRRIVLVCLLSFILSSSLAFAHDFWLEPSESFTPAAGEIISMRMFVGEAFRPEQELPPVADRVTRIDGVGPKGKLVIEPGARRDPLPALALSDLGTYVIVMEREPSFITLAAEKFNSYLEEEGHHAIVAARMKDGSYAKDGRERYTRHLKMILNVGESTSGWSHLFGTRLEIVPLADPGKLKPGSELPLRVLFDGKPLAGVRVGIVTRNGSEISREKMVRTNAGGEARLTLETAGDLLVRTTYMRPCARCEDADYESFWSSMTVAIPQ